MERHARAAQRIIPSQLNANHHWAVEPQQAISFVDLVEDNNTPRTDCARYKMISSVDPQKAKDRFSLLGCSKTLFTITGTLQCDRTYARDVEEVYYIDTMDNYLRGLPEDLSAEYIPLIQRALHTGRYSSFAKRQHYFTEHYERRRLNMWLPHDAYENSEFSDAELSAWFPKSEDWLTDIKQPSALPVPVPPVVYYYHRELTMAQNSSNAEISELIRRLRFNLRYEFYILFVSTWWNEAFFGGRQYVLEESTINTLSEYLEGVNMIANKPVQAIIEHMRSAHRRLAQVHNWMCFRDETMEESTFVWAVERVGEFDGNERPRRTLWCSLSSRKITLQWNSSNLFKRTTVLDRKLSRPDLDMVDGLPKIVDLNRWNVYGTMRVGDLIANLIELYQSTEKKLDDCTRPRIPPTTESHRWRDDPYQRDRPHYDRFPVANNNSQRWRDDPYSEVPNGTSHFWIDNDTVQTIWYERPSMGDVIVVTSIPIKTLYNAI